MIFDGNVYTSYDGEIFGTAVECLKFERLSRSIAASDAEMYGDWRAWMAEGLSPEEAFEAVSDGKRVAS